MSKGTNPDKDQAGVEWVELDRLEGIEVYPKALASKIRNNDFEIRYLGDIN